MSEKTKQKKTVQKKTLEKKITGYGAGTVDVVMSVDQVAKKLLQSQKMHPQLKLLRVSLTMNHF